MQSLPDAKNGHFTCDASPPYQAGSVASLLCDTGYACRTDPKSVLTSDQGRLRWVPPSAVCEQALYALPVVEHGRLVCDSEPPYFEGTRARHECDDGYRRMQLNDIYTVTLYRDRLLWYLDFFAPKCEPVLEDLPVAENGHFSTNLSPPYREDESVQLICDEGYHSKTVIESYATIMENGVLQWDPPSVTCYPNWSTLFFLHRTPIVIGSVSVIILCLFLIRSIRHVKLKKLT